MTKTCHSSVTIFAKTHYKTFFGAQRKKGSTSDNPSVSEFLNTGALRVVNSFCQAPRNGNCPQESVESLTLAVKENIPLQRHHK